MKLAPTYNWTIFDVNFVRKEKYSLLNAKNIPDVLNSLLPALCGSLLEGAGDQVLLFLLDCHHPLFNTEKTTIHQMS